ncbi:serine protease [Bdellovibrio sp. qaytius]|nr:serine protease [Bdellovibrio sp. qaytius]
MLVLNKVRWLFTALAFIFLSQVVHADDAAISGEYIIKFKPQTASVRLSGKSGVASMAAANKLAALKGERILSAFKGINIQVKIEAAGLLHISDVSPTNLQALKVNPEVEYIEPNYILSLDPGYQQNSQSVGAMGAPASATDTYSQSYAPMQVTESWAIEKLPASATKTIVAVVDTGLDIHHAVFADSNAVYQNLAELNGLPGVDDDGNGYIDDVNGWNFVDNSPNMYDDADHGTHVSGLILGTGQDIWQVPVRESKVRIMPLKFLNGSGSGSTANAINAIYYAVNNGAKVINNSWGGGSYSRALLDAYKYAYDHDVVLVTAAGNSNDNLNSSPTYPANFDTPSNLTVGASTASDRRASFSNYSSTYVNIFAPGTDTMSTIPGSQCANANNLYNYCIRLMRGTSMASPIVAGIAALAIREAPQLSAYQIRSLLMSSVDISSDLSGYSQTGGRVNALKVMQNAQSQVSASAWSPTYSPVYKTDSSSQASGGGAAAPGGCGMVKAIGEEFNQGPPSGGQMGQALLFGAMMLLPLGIAFGLRRKQVKPHSLRQYERFSVAKDVMIQIGDQVVNAASQTLAVGGLSFKSEQQFEKGQKIKLKIADVHEEVEGEIVWSSELNSFGVKFLNITDNLKTQVQGLTRGLVPTS